MLDKGEVEEEEEEEEKALQPWDSCWEQGWRG